MRDRHKYDWLPPESALHVPRTRPVVHPAVIAWCIGLGVFWTAVWLCLR